VLELVEDDNTFEPWDWDEGVIDDAHGEIEKSASEWLKNRVDELDPNNPDFKPWMDMLTIQQVPEIWNVKFTIEAMNYKKEHFYDKYDEWLKKRADAIMTLGDLENMSIFQDAFYEDEYYGKFSDEAKKYKEEQMRKKFASIMAKEIQKPNADIEKLAHRCEIIINHTAGNPRQELSDVNICRELRDGDSEGALEKLKLHKEGLFGSLVRWVVGIFTRNPEPVEVNPPEDFGNQHGMPRVLDEELVAPYKDEWVTETCNPNKVVEKAQGEECDPWADPDGCTETGYHCEFDCSCVFAPAGIPSVLEWTGKEDIPAREPKNETSAEDAADKGAECKAEDDAYYSESLCKLRCDESGGAFQCMKNYKTGCWDCVYQDIPQLTFPEGKTECGLSVDCPPPQPGCRLVGFIYVKNHAVESMWGQGKPSNKNGYVYINSLRKVENGNVVCDEIVSCIYDCDEETCPAAYRIAACGQGATCTVECAEEEDGGHVCGDGVCGRGELCSECHEDCRCSPGHVCMPDHPDSDSHGCYKAVCGDGLCMPEAGERCSCHDCECPLGMVCDPSHPFADNLRCSPEMPGTGAVCGNGICEETEYCYTCQQDCKCGPEEFCSPDNPGIGCMLMQ